MTNWYFLKITNQMINKNSQTLNVETESPLTICSLDIRSTPLCTPSVCPEPLLPNQCTHQKSFKNSKLNSVNTFSRTPGRRRRRRQQCSTVHHSASTPATALVSRDLSSLPLSQNRCPLVPYTTTPSTPNRAEHPFLPPSSRLSPQSTPGRPNLSRR